MVQLKMGDYKGLGQFVSKYPQVVAQSEIQNLLAEAANALRAGKEGLAQTYVHHAVVLQKCSKIKVEERKFLFQDLDGRRETTKDLIADVNKVYNAIKSQATTPQPPRQGGATQDMGMVGPDRDRRENPQPRVIQGYEQIETVPRPGVERVNSQPNQPQLRQVKDRDGRLVYVDSQGRKVRPASSRQDDHRGRHDSERGPLAEEMAHLKVDESRPSRGTGTSARNKGKGPTSADPMSEHAEDMHMGPPSGGIQHRRKLTITGTDGDTEWLDAGELAPVC